MTQPEDINAIVAHYEGLIHTTAIRYEPYVQESLEDIKQILRIKAWKAALSYDKAKAGHMDRDRYVFSCMWNQCKDLVRKKKRNEVYIDDVSSSGSMNDGGRIQHENGSAPRDKWEARHMSVTEEHGIASVSEAVNELELTGIHAEVANLLHDGYKRSEIYPQLGLKETELRGIISEIAELAKDVWGYEPSASAAA